MAFQTPITVKDAIDNIHRKRYLLPAIQREVVWQPDQIQRLFDSLMREYPIGSFLFWHVPKVKSKDYQFYEFVRTFHERDTPHNAKANITGEDDITAVLDGQQRLTSLYIGLKGTYANKLLRKRWDNDQAFPERSLYLNLLRPATDDELVYDFRLLTREEAESPDDGSFWFPVGTILDLDKEYQVNDFLIANAIMQLPQDVARFANSALFRLHTSIHRDLIINYYLERGTELDKVLNIFIRINSGGTPLSHSDLLLSIATAQWQTRDAREEITRFVDELNGIGDGFGFTKDFVLKACLVLNDAGDIAFKADNFNRRSMTEIEGRWDLFAQALRLAVTLAARFGYNRDTLTSTNALIPLAYYLLRRDLPNNFEIAGGYSEDRRLIRKWLATSLLKRVFGGQADTVLSAIRKLIADAHAANGKGFAFPLEAIIERFKGGSKSILFDEDEIEHLFSYQYGQGYTFSTLALLYPTLDFGNKFHQDHVYPRRLFGRAALAQRGITGERADLYIGYCDSLANLQLLEGIPNQEKAGAEFEEWLGNTYPSRLAREEIMTRHYIPRDTGLAFGEFPRFIEKRRSLMKERYRELLNVG